MVKHGISEFGILEHDWSRVTSNLFVKPGPIR